MPLPTSSDVHVDTMLTNVSIAYKNLAYIADQIFPIVPVRRQSDIIPDYSQSYWFRDEAKLRAPGTKSQGGGYAVNKNTTYFCHRYSSRKEIADETRSNADLPFNLDTEATEFVTDKLAMRRENAFATDFFTAGVWGADSTPANLWSNYAASSPIVDLDSYKDTVEGRVGVEPNKLVLGKAVWLQLKNHPDFIDLIKYTQTGVLSEQLFASLSGFAQVLIGRSIITTDKEGTAEASVTYSRIWGKNGLAIYVPPAPSLLRPAAGYTFVWQRVPAAIQYIVRHRDDQAETDIIESNSYFDQRATATNAGQFLSAVVA